jgi:hypothetical protein
MSTKRTMQQINETKRWFFEKINKSWVAVAHACIPSYLGGWDWEDHSLKQDKKVSETPSQKKKVVHGDAYLSFRL